MIPWWTEQQAGYIGAFIGLFFGGVMGGGLGVLGSICIPRGKCKRIILGLLIGNIAIGIVALLAAAFALAQHQPYWVYHPLLILGLVSTLAFGSVFPNVRRSYKAVELRKLETEEFRRS